MDNPGLDEFFKNLVIEEELQGPVLPPEEVEKEKEILGKFTDGELLVIADLVARLPAKEHINKEIDYMREELSDDTKLRVSVQDDKIEFIIDKNECGGLYIMELTVHPKMGIILNMRAYQEDWDIVDPPIVCLNCEGELVIEKIIGHITDVNAFGYEIHYDICTYRCSNCGSLHQGQTCGGGIEDLVLIPEEKKENPNPFIPDPDPSVPFNSEPFTSDPFEAPPFSIEPAHFPTWEELEKKREDLVYFVNISGDEQIASLLRDAYTELHLTVWGEDDAEKALEDVYSHLMTLKRAGVKRYKKFVKEKDDRVDTLLTSRIIELEYRIKGLERELAEFKTKSNWDSFGL